MAVSKSSSTMATIDNGDSAHPSRHHPPRSLGPPAGDLREGALGSCLDFLPRLDMSSASAADPIADPIAPEHEAHRDTTVTSAQAGDPVWPAGLPLTPARLAALDESRDSMFEIWIEAVQENSRLIVERVSGPADDDICSTTGADELIAIGEWCPVDALRDYPAALQPEDMLEDDDELADWVEITHDDI